MMSGEFKQTEIGRVPKEWEVVRLGDIGTLQYGFTASAKREDTGVKFLRITDIRDNGIVDWLDLPFCEVPESEFKKYELKKGDILFARIGATTGKACYVDREVKSVFASYLIRFQPKEDIDTKFLHFCTQSSIYWQQVNRKKGGQLKKGLNAKMLSALKFPLPSLPEQHHIAEILSTVDRAIQRVDEAIARTERLKRGLMQELLTRGIGHKEFKDTEIGRIPKEWEVKELEDVAEDIIDCLHSKKPKRVEKGKILLHHYNIGENGKLDLSDLYFISENDFKEWSRRVKPLKGDIIITKVGTFGLIAQFDVDLECAIGRNLVVIRPDENKILSDYLKQYMLSPEFKKELDRVVHFGSIHKSLHVKKILQLRLPLPKVKEQEKIAEILSTVGKELELERERKGKLERIKGGLMNDLLTGKKRIDIEG